MVEGIARLNTLRNPMYFQPMQVDVPAALERHLCSAYQESYGSFHRHDGHHSMDLSKGLPPAMQPLKEQISFILGGMSSTSIIRKTHNGLHVLVTCFLTSSSLLCHMSCLEAGVSVAFPKTSSH